MWYRAGTLSLTNGSAAVVGTGTTFLTGAREGDALRINGVIYEILTINTATSITLGSPYLGATAAGVAFEVIPTQGYVRELAIQVAALVATSAGAQAGALLVSAANKPVPLGADSFAIKDSVSGQGRMVTLTSLKAALPLSGLPDVDMVGANVPTEGEALIYNAAAGKWLPGAVVLAGGASANLSPTLVLPIAVSDETTGVSAGGNKVTFRVPFGMTLTGVRASVTVAPTGAPLVMDINVNGNSILSPKLSIDAGERSSSTAAVPAVLLSVALADDDEITVDIDAVGTVFAGSGLKVYLIGQAVTTARREILSASRTYYVRTDGNNSNTGLTNTSGGAFLTIQKAVDTAVRTIDFGPYAVTIQVGDGAYTAGFTMTGPLMGSGSLTIQGNAATPANVLLNVSTSTDVILAERGARVVVKDMKLVNTSSFLLRASTGAHIEFAGMNFGACSSQQVRADDLGMITCSGDYTISGGAGVHLSFVTGQIRVQSKTITLTGTPAFATSFLNGGYGGAVIINGNTYSGSATGVRYDIVGNGVVFTAAAGETYLPGSILGTKSTGGQYF